MKQGERIFLKSPFENVFNLLNVIPQGHEKALKHALYNAVATLLLMLGIVASCGLFYILEPFVKPLIWAFLVGSVLHPFKRSLEKRFESWLNILDTSSQPLIIAVVMIPIHLVDDISELIGSTIRKYLEWIICLCISLVIIFLTYTYIPHVFLSTIYIAWKKNCELNEWLLNNITTTVYITFGIAYIGFLLFSWSKERSYYFIVGSYVAWFVTIVFVARTIGILTIPLFLLFNVCLLVGFAYEVSHIYKLSKHRSYLTSIWIALSGSSTSTSVQESQSASYGMKTKSYDDKDDDHDDGSGDDGVTKFDDVSSHFEENSPERKSVPNFGSQEDISSRSNPEAYLTRQSSPSAREGDSIQSSNTESSKYIYGVMWACGLILVWKNIWLIHLLPIPISLYLVKRIGYYFGLWSVIHVHTNRTMDRVHEWIHERHEALFPAPVHGLYKLGCSTRGWIMAGLRDSISSFSSTLVILGLLLFTFSVTSFLILKIYAEGIHLLAVGASIINSTVVHNPEFLQWLPQGWSDKMESVLNNAYIYGREGISKQLRSLLKDVESAKALELEAQVLEFWDRVYQAWLMSAVESSSVVGPKVPSTAVAASLNSFFEIVQKTPGVLNMSLITEFLKDNLETLFSLLESVWVLLKGNITLVFHFLFAALSVLLGGGSAVLNFMLNGIVFFTALFYLLSSSRDSYKPVDLLSNFSPANGTKVGVAFEAAVNGVFKASFHMALFYGLWTWLIHNLFQVRIIYLPSVLAALLGAVPFLGTYWASIPAVLELWLAQQQGILALTLLVFQCLPMSFVDTAIYMEIRGGGHPYMTGLAIAGGVFCMGIQGAIFGPLLLCCLMVALNMSSNLMKDSPFDSDFKALSMRQLRRMDTIL